MRPPRPLFPTSTCNNCGRNLAPGAERFRINDRFWCAACAKPYVKGPLECALRDTLMFCVASVAGVVAWVLVGQTILARMSLYVGGVVFAWIFVQWMMRRKVHVERVLPECN